jgi:hypothetical protein
MWLETHVESQDDYYRDLPYTGLAKDLIDQDIEFLKELWQGWED